MKEWHPLSLCNSWVPAILFVFPARFSPDFISLPCFQLPSLCPHSLTRCLGYSGTQRWNKRKESRREGIQGGQQPVPVSETPEEQRNSYFHCVICEMLGLMEEKIEMEKKACFIAGKVSWTAKQDIIKLIMINLHNRIILQQLKLSFWIFLNDMENVHEVRLLSNVRVHSHPQETRYSTVVKSMSSGPTLPETQLCHLWDVEHVP